MGRVRRIYEREQSTMFLYVLQHHVLSTTLITCKDIVWCIHDASVLTNCLLTCIAVDQLYAAKVIWVKG